MKTPAKKDIKLFCNWLQWNNENGQPAPMKMCLRVGLETEFIWSDRMQFCQGDCHTGVGPFVTMVKVNEVFYRVVFSTKFF